MTTLTGRNDRRLRRLLAMALALAAFSAALPAQVAEPPKEPMRPPLLPGADPNDWEPYFDRGNKLFREDAKAAAPYFYWASRLDPSRAEPYFARWANYLFRAKNEDIYAYLRSDEALLRRADFQEAYGWRRIALMRNPFVHRGFEMLVYDRLPGQFSDSRDMRAWIAYTEGKFAQAVASHTRTIERGGAKAVWNRHDRALAAVMAGDMALALTDLKALVEELRRQDDQRMVALYASKEHLLYMIGLLHNQMGDRAAARSAFGEATVENAAFGYGWAGLAALSGAARQHAQAVGEYEQALQLEPDDGYLHYLHGVALFNAQRYEGAATALQQAIRLEPHYAQSYYMLGRVRERQGREAEAYPHYEAFVQRASARDPQAKSMRFRLELRARADTSRRTP